jgi:hypothetical protein
MSEAKYSRHSGMSEQRTRSVAARQSPKGDGAQPPKNLRKYTKKAAAK